jgi:hypothetical protein
METAPDLDPETKKELVKELRGTKGHDRQKENVRSS